MKDLKEGNGMDIAIDSIALSSFVEKNLSISLIEPRIAEKYIIGALKEAGFAEVIQYDQFLLRSIEKDIQENNPGSKKMLSWCKAAFNYVQTRIPDSKLVQSEKNAPWRLLLEEEKDKEVCLLSPCTAMKNESTFRHVISSMELDELFKKLEINPEFSALSDYRSRIQIGKNHPGFSPVESIIQSNVTSLKLSKRLIDDIDKIKGDFLDLYPCLARCLTGGSNYPTANSTVIEGRCNWLESLWEV